MTSAPQGDIHMIEAQHESARRLYDKRASHYDESWHPSFANYMVEVADLKPGDRVLDLACGTGLVTFSAAEKVGPHGTVVGVDISRGMLAEAERKKRQSLKASNVALHLHDIGRLDELEGLRHDAFDVIIVASALVLFESPAEMIGLWINYLRPGGRLVVDAISPHNAPVGLALERTGLAMGIAIPYHRNWCRSEDSLRSVLESAGLVVEWLVAKEQQGGGVTYRSIEDAGSIFENNVDTEATKVLGSGGVRERAKDVFRDVWLQMAVDGKVKDEDCVWVAVAVKPRKT